MKKNKRAQTNYEEVGKYILWFILTIILSIGLYYLINYLTSKI